MTQTMRVSHPSELISLIPYQLGYVPSHSLVVVSLTGPRQTVGVIARCDLRDVGDPPTITALVGACLRDQATKILPVIYLDQPHGATHRGLQDHDRADIVRAIKALTYAAGGLINEHELWVVTADGAFAWCDLKQCDKAECTNLLPPNQRYASPNDIKSSRISAAMVVAGRSYVARREDLYIDQYGDDLRRLDLDERVVRWEERWTLARDCASRTSLRHAAVHAVQTLLATHNKTDDPHRDCLNSNQCSARNGLSAMAGEDNEIWATVSAAVNDTCVRDGLLVAMTPLGIDALADYVRADGCIDDFCVGGADCVAWPRRDDMACEALQFIMHSPTAMAPQHCGFTDIMELLSQGVTLAPERLRTAFHTLLALGYWWQGDGARASIHLEQAQRRDPTYRLASLLHTVVQAGLAPAWARRDEDRDESEIS